MKKVLMLLLAGSTIALAGCFDTTQEITINSDGSGVLSNTNDMSAVIGMAKQFGGEQVAEMEKMVQDTIVQLAQLADSIPNLTPQERDLVKKGSFGINMNLKNDKFITKLIFPFQQTTDISILNNLSVKLISEVMKKQMGTNPATNPMGGEAPDPSSFDDYYVTSFKNGKIEKKLNKEKFANAEKDEYLMSMKEMAGMGAPMTNNVIINLPRPAKKVEGKNIKLSDDKKQLTIKTDVDDFFDHPEKLEFKIEY